MASRNIFAQAIVHHIRAKFIALLMKQNAIMIQHSFNLGRDYLLVNDISEWDWDSIEDYY